MIQILIVDDHPLIREGFKKIIGQEVDMKVVAECQNAAEVPDFLRDGECDVIVLDINLPGRSGLDLLAELPLRESGIKVLVLSMSPEKHFAMRALKSGASGYLTKDTAAEELVEAIRKVNNGGKYVSSTLGEQLANDLQHNHSGAAHEGLSGREFEVLLLIGAGMSAKDIKKKLKLSASTVKTYRQRILEKLNLQSTAEIIRYAVKNNLVD